MRILLIIMLIGSATGLVWAQDCEQNLADSKREYFNGRFQEVLDLLTDCKDNFQRKDEKKESLELLCNSNLVLDNHEAADQYMEELLQLDPLYQPRNTDLVEFRELYDSYEIQTKFNYMIMLYHTIALH